MKIAFIIEAWEPMWGGGQVHLHELATRLVNKYGYEVDIYTRKLTGLTKYSDYQKKAGYNVYRIGPRTSYGSMIGRMGWVLTTFFKLLPKKYDIIHGQANIGGVPTWMLSRFKRNTLSLFTVHGSGLKVWDEMASGLSQKINYQIEKTVQTRLKYDLEISVDSAFCQFKNVNQIKVIPNGVNIEEFDYVKAEKIKNKFIFVGRLHPQKGLKYLIQAVDLVRDLDFKIHIIGSGDLEKSLREEIDRYKLTDKFIFRGKMSDYALIKEYKEASLFILPSVFEGQPLTILEAWAAKTPVLVTDVGDNSRMVVDGVNGWLIKSQDPIALADTIRLATTSDLVNMGKEGYKTVQHYTWDIMAEKYNEIYKKSKGELLCSDGNIF